VSTCYFCWVLLGRRSPMFLKSCLCSCSTRHFPCSPLCLYPFLHHLPTRPPYLYFLHTDITRSLVQARHRQRRLYRQRLCHARVHEEHLHGALQRQQAAYWVVYPSYPFECESPGDFFFFVSFLFRTPHLVLLLICCSSKPTPVSTHPIRRLT
jgi:hypothetical protein